MPTPEQQDTSLMRAMFSTVAPRYDFITRAFSYGMDTRWKRDGVECGACYVDDVSELTTAGGCEV